jgi:hypothetical protein
MPTTLLQASPHAPMGLRFRAARRFRAVRFARRGPSTGGSPLVDSAVSGFTAPLLGFPCTTLSACTGALEALTTRVRHTRMRAHATLLTLTPTLPSRPDPCGPAFRLDFLSWVCPKIAPPSSHVEESAAREPRLRESLRGTTAGRSRVPPSWFRTTSAAFSSPTVQVCCALLPILGFIVFLPVAKRASPRCVPALRSFPSADSGSPGSRRNRGLASRTAHCWTCPSPRALPPRPSLRAP